MAELVFRLTALSSPSSTPLQSTAKPTALLVRQLLPRRRRFRLALAPHRPRLPLRSADDVNRHPLPLDQREHPLTSGSRSAHTTTAASASLTRNASRRSTASTGNRTKSATRT